MRTTQFLLATVKEIPNEAELASHQLMIRAGMIRKLAAGIYTWLPLGLRVLKKVEQIVREEMDRIGAQEILMPSIQPAELWLETHRWNKYGHELLKISDRHHHEFCYGPTHEEVITDLARRELKSYKQLPLTLYQIQTKFRDEIRPRFGVMRAREFLMKDAYSFHTDRSSLQKTYEILFEAYSRIFSRLGLKFRPVLADTGNIGGHLSHEFQVLAEAGESIIAYSDESDYAANIEMAEALPSSSAIPPSGLPKQLIDTPQQKTIEEVSQFLNVPKEKIIKTLVVRGSQTPLVALVLRGDHTLNAVKTEKLPQIVSPLTLVSDEEIYLSLGVHTGSLGPIQLKIPVIADRSAALMTDFVCGANQDGKHASFVNWERDAHFDEIADIRNVMEGDPSPDGKGRIKIMRGIEVGQTFQLGTRYSEAMELTVLNEQGQATPVIMGCYGIGVSRTVAAAIEQYHDDKGICWPLPMAPFQIALVPLMADKCDEVRVEAEKLYDTLRHAGYDVLLDDRPERPGVKFADMDLIGIPHRLVISERGLKNNQIEYKRRSQSECISISLSHLDEFIKKIMA